MGFLLERRQFLAGISATAALAYLDLPVLAAQSETSLGETGLGAWIRIGKNGAVTILQPQAEMGQGVNTSISMLIAEELEVDVRRVTVEFPPAAAAYANKVYGFQTTAESTSIRSFFDKCRTVGAQAREMLVSAAAKKWRLDPATLRAEAGYVVDPQSGNRLGYGELAEAASKLPAPEKPRLKSKSEWKIIGKPVKRLDTAAKTNGKAVYGIDVKVPGMLTAAVMQCPVPGGKLKSVDEKPALAVTGVKQVVKLDNLVAVLADGYWQAKAGLDALSIEWDRGVGDGFTTEMAFAQFRQALDKKPGSKAEETGNVDAAFTGAAKVIAAEYTAPYLAHATMEPQNATAHYTPDKLTIWAPTQAQGLVGIVIGPLVGLKADQVECHTAFLGGGFGRRFELDVPIQAALISKAAKVPVKVIWSREEDMSHDFYRPGAVVRLEAAIDGDRKITGLRTKIASSSILSRAVPDLVKDGIDITAVDGVKGTDYEFGSRTLHYNLENTPIPVGFWRSVAHSINGWVMEGFVNELAIELNEDPVALRRELLAGKARNISVLDALAERSDWTKKTAGRYKGIAIHHSFDAIIGHVVEISVPKLGQIRIEKITTVADVGTAINPDTIRAQIQSAIVYGLSAAMTGETVFAGGEAVQKNFDSFEVLRLASMPQIDVHILELGGAIAGVGEPGLPPLAPALVAAVNVAFSRRIRSLPLAGHGVALA
ncbi:MAG: xanthine dehydrogenase family protein molybdopterin-binding subunit [Bradyrhizobiaceae bacterium]|jgi:isoquinoline 1-oxidoreductase beta subunit|nr:MAG: xanthine dehydrogenase family protein molybdopterin-binding subunit [Bradyrhizobiaceae bacterium]